MLWIHGLTVKLLVQVTVEMASLPTVTAVRLHHSAMDKWLTVMLLVQGRGEMVVLLAVTAALLHHIALDTWTDCNIVSTW